MSCFSKLITNMRFGIWIKNQHLLHSRHLVTSFKRLNTMYWGTIEVSFTDSLLVVWMQRMVWMKTGLVTKKHKQQWFVTKGHATTSIVIKRQASRYCYKEPRVDTKGYQKDFVTKEWETKFRYKDRSNIILLQSNK